VADEVDGSETSFAMSLSGDEIFVSAKPIRRDHVPVALRRGRHRSKGSSRTRARSTRRAVTTAGMHLVDVDGEAETMRIALRRSFEDVPSAETFELQESAAG